MVTLEEYIKKVVDKPYENMSPKELIKQPVNAISGISEEDAKLLRKAFKIKTIEDLACNPFVYVAQSLVNLSKMATKSLDKKYKPEKFKKLGNLPIEAIKGISKEDAKLLYKAFKIKTIKQFALNKYVEIAQKLYTLACVQDFLEKCAAPEKPPEKPSEEATKTEG
ncbi:MAG: hypothetical protein QXF09_04465 [Nitrososphaerota archaeon]